MTIKFNAETQSIVSAILIGSKDVSLLDLFNTNKNQPVRLSVEDLDKIFNLKEIKTSIEENAKNLAKKFIFDKSAVLAMKSTNKPLDRLVDLFMFESLFIDKESISDLDNLYRLIYALSTCDNFGARIFYASYVGYFKGQKVAEFSTKQEAQAFKNEKPENYFEEAFSVVLSDELRQLVVDLGASSSTEELELLKALLWLHSISKVAASKLRPLVNLAYSLYSNGFYAESEDTWDAFLNLIYTFDPESDDYFEALASYTANVIKFTTKSKGIHFE